MAHIYTWSPKVIVKQAVGSGIAIVIIQGFIYICRDIEEG